MNQTVPYAYSDRDGCDILIGEGDTELNTG